MALPKNSYVSDYRRPITLGIGATYLVGGLCMAMGEHPLGLVVLPGHLILTIINDNPFDLSIPTYK